MNFEVGDILYWKHLGISKTINNITITSKSGVIINFYDDANASISNHKVVLDRLIREGYVSVYPKRLQERIELWKNMK